MKIFYAASVRKWLLNLPAKTTERILLKLAFYAQQENPLVFAKNLGGGFSRFRIGDYRVIFYIEKETIQIVNVDRRDKVYK